MIFDFGDEFDWEDWIAEFREFAKREGHANKDIR